MWCFMNGYLVFHVLDGQWIFILKRAKKQNQEKSRETIKKDPCLIFFEVHMNENCELVSLFCIAFFYCCICCLYSWKVETQMDWRLS